MTQYEWDIETWEGEEILDHNHADKLLQFSDEDLKAAMSENESRLVLVRDIGNEDDGLQDRTWAYVTDGKLSDAFCDSRELPQTAVPNRFRIEFSQMIKRINNE